MEQLITKVTQTIQRKNGSEVKICAQVISHPGLSQSIDVFVMVRDKPEDEWKLCDKRSKMDGKPEMLKVVTYGEILRLTSLLGKPLPETNEANTAFN